MGQRTYTIDAELIFADGAAAVTADGASQVDGSAFSLDVGPARFEGVMLIDVSAIAIDGNDEKYQLTLQGSNTSDFSGAKENLAMLELGATEVRAGGAQDSTIGRYELPFCNEQDDVVYQYLRLYNEVTGATVSITYHAFASVKY